MKGLSKETRKRISEAQTGKRRGKYKMSEKKRPPVSDETRKKLSEAIKGKLHSIEHNAKIAKSLRKRREEKKLHNSTPSPNQWTSKDVTSIRQFNTRMRALREERLRCMRLGIEPSKKPLNGATNIQYVADDVTSSQDL